MSGSLRVERTAARNGMDFPVIIVQVAIVCKASIGGCPSENKTHTARVSVPGNRNFSDGSCTTWTYDSAHSGSDRTTSPQKTSACGTINGYHWCPAKHQDESQITSACRAFRRGGRSPSHPALKEKTTWQPSSRMPSPGGSAARLQSSLPLAGLAKSKKRSSFSCTLF